MDYIDRYSITSEKLQQQSIAAYFSATPLTEFPAWLSRRAEALAEAANNYLSSLKGDLVLPAVVATAESSEHAYADD